MTDLPYVLFPVCKLCGAAAIPLIDGSVKHDELASQCSLRLSVLTGAEWAALMGRGEPVAWVHKGMDGSIKWEVPVPDHGTELYAGSPPAQPERQAPAVDGAVIREAIRTMDDSERLDIFSEYCRCCGSNDPTCQCWNDE